ncbi:MAG: RHS repeat protein [Oligoflexia bacterium]|nr:RHS repeat protein [Oligoflexia bacterium]
MKSKVKFFALAVGSLSLALAPQANALVALGNGNYFVGFTDLEHDSAMNTFQLKIQRTYNSRSQYDGIFGYGWGSDFEGFLIPSADGSVVIQESGGGDTTRFSPKDFSKAQLSAQIDKLLAENSKKNKITASATAELKNKLLVDANARDELSRDLGIFPDLPVGTKLYSTQRGDTQVVTVIKGGYVREYGDGKQELFDKKLNVVDQGVDSSRGRVLKGVYKVSRLVDPIRKVQVFYDYDKNGRVSLVTDKKAQKIRFSYDGSGKVSQVIDAKGTKAFFKYCESGGSLYNAAKKCGRGDLIWSKDTSGSEYSYQYDSLHNLTRIGYPKNGKPNQEFEEVSYWPSNSAGSGGVKTVKNPNGVQIDYAYWKNEKDKDGHYKTTVTNTYSSGKKSETSYEYFEKRRADGSKYRYKLISVVDGEKTETIYNECCGQPLSIVTGGATTRFEYYAGSGLPWKKDSPEEHIEWQYHTKFKGKITKVVVNDKQAKNVKTSQFFYEDKSGQLTKAITSDGKGIVLQYDSQGRIFEMFDQDKKKITFKYSGGATKPSEIIQDGVGAIQISFDKGGNISGVKSQGGRQIAVSVAAAFQNLLEIIKPAGIQPI